MQQLRCVTLVKSFSVRFVTSKTCLSIRLRWDSATHWGSQMTPHQVIQGAANVLNHVECTEARVRILWFANSVLEDPMRAGTAAGLAQAAGWAQVCVIAMC